MTRHKRAVFRALSYPIVYLALSLLCLPAQAQWQPDPTLSYDQVLAELEVAVRAHLGTIKELDFKVAYVVDSRESYYRDLARRQDLADTIPPRIVTLRGDQAHWLQAIGDVGIYSGDRGQRIADARDAVDRAARALFSVNQQIDDLKEQIDDASSEAADLDDEFWLLWSFDPTIDYETSDAAAAWADVAELEEDLEAVRSSANSLDSELGQAQEELKFLEQEEPQITAEMVAEYRARAQADKDEIESLQAQLNQEEASIDFILQEIRSSDEDINNWQNERDAIATRIREIGAWLDAHPADGEIPINFKMLQSSIAPFMRQDHVVGGPGGLSNLSIRARAGTGDQTLIAGFIIDGDDQMPMLVRATGPTLANFGIANFLPDPKVKLTLNGAEIASNDSWLSGPNPSDLAAAGGDRLGGYALAANEAVILSSLSRGLYTAIVTGNNGSAGVTLFEAYDRRVSQAGQAKFINLSVRTQVGTGDDVIIAGFMINGPSDRRVMIRGLGSTLTNFGVGGTLADPQLDLSNGAGRIFGNNDWGTLQAAPPCAAGICNFAGSTAEILAANGDAIAGYPIHEKDAILIATLPPGAYTAILSGADGGTGVGLLEIYLLE